MCVYTYYNQADRWRIEKIPKGLNSTEHGGETNLYKICNLNNIILLSKLTNLLNPITRNSYVSYSSNIQLKIIKHIDAHT